MNKKQKSKALEALQVFIKNPKHKSLNNHKLSGKWSKYRSINITSDLRAIYVPINKTLVRFIDIGSHSKLYS